MILNELIYIIYVIYIYVTHNNYELNCIQIEDTYIDMTSPPPAPRGMHANLKTPMVCKQCTDKQTNANEQPVLLPPQNTNRIEKIYI